MRKLVLLFIAILTFTNSVSQVVEAESSADRIVVKSLQKKGIVFSDDNTVTLLTSGQQKFDDMFQAIRQARHSVHLEYFNFRNDSIASLLFDILAEKAAEGVEVRALYDAFGNASNNQPLKAHHIKALRERGIQIYEFDPLSFPWLNHVFTRDHRKIVVIDGKIAYTGGMNVADYYIKGTEVVGSWRDMHCRLEGSEVSTLQRIFIKIWNKVTGEDLHGEQYFWDGLPYKTSPGQLYPQQESFAGLRANTCESMGKMKVGIINREHGVTPSIIRDFYLDAINAAQDTIRLVNPYLTLSPKLMKALKRAVKRGVAVQIMVSEPSDIPLTPDCVFWNVNKLQKAGCEVWIYRPGFHHTKVIMVDGKLCTVGSANLNSRSLRWDYEENAVIIDPNVTRQLSDIFDHDKADSFRLTSKVWRTWRTPWQRFRAWFAHILGPFL